jgi:GTPase
MFLDEAVVEFVSGKGGDGSASMHREKHVPRGGPNGADGGRGGDVVLVADRHKRTLYDLKLTSKYEAEPGVDAHGNKTGKDGKSTEVHIPIGTVVVDAETNDVLVDLSTDGMRYVICRGGKGGFGNLHYVSSVRQTPTFAQKGAPGERVRAKLELKMLADVGLVGLPNAGKSTLISRVSAAKPKIADYPFTTITPNLGVVSIGDETFVVADMPGLIEGASEGHGLGHQFLRHVERTRVLVHVVDCFPIDGSDPLANFDLIEEELRKYSLRAQEDQEEDAAQALQATLYERPRLVALNKIDVAPAEHVEELATALGKAMNERFGPPREEGEQRVFAISGVTGEGLEPLLFAILTHLRRAEKEAPVPVITPTLRPEEDLSWDVERRNGDYVVTGKRVERMVAMTDLNNDEALRYLHRRLVRMGVIEKLREMGAEEGDTVIIGEVELGYTEAS